MITPPALSADQNNYSPAGLATASLIRQDITTAVTITGIVAPALPNTLLTLRNIRTAALLEAITIAHESGLSLAANRFSLPARNTWYIPTGGSITFIYDGTISRWVVWSTGVNTFPASNSDGGPGIQVGNPAENIGLRREATSVIGMIAAATARETWSGAVADPNPVTFPPAAFTQMSGQMRWSAVQAIGPLAGTVDNQAIALTTLTARITTSAPTTITGFTNGAAGRVLTVVNASANNIQINSEDAGSTAANRFLLSTANITITPEGVAQFWYDTTSSRWRRLSGL